MKESIDEIFARRMLASCPHDEKAQTFLAALLAASREGHMCLIAEEGPTLPGEIVCREENRWYLKRNWECERRFTSGWMKLRGKSPSIPFHPTLQGLQLEQAEAIRKCANHSLSIICGGPGTGKTFTARALISLYLKEARGRVAVAAPTGKATLRLKEGLGDLARQCTIQTLHTLLKRGGVLPFDLLVIDEGSMIDAELMGHLFSSVKEGSRLVILGDHEQLPPVESGNFFSDLVALENATQLQTCLRTDIKEIIDLAGAARSGGPIPYLPLPSVDTLVDQVLSRFDFESPERFRVLCPVRAGPLGVDTLNALIHQRVPAGAPLPILITVNDARLDLFNGDAGVLCGDEALFSGGRRIPKCLLPKWELSYVLSVHKSQGSEYEEVVVLLPEGSQHFSRSMLYTAITRAKRRVEIYGQEGVVEQILKKEERRLSGISSRLMPNRLPARGVARIEPFDNNPKECRNRTENCADE